MFKLHDGITPNPTNNLSERNIQIHLHCTRSANNYISESASFKLLFYKTLESWMQSVIKSIRMYHLHAKNDQLKVSFIHECNKNNTCDTMRD